MQATPFDAGGRQALGIRVAVDNSAELAEEFQKVTEALLDWHGKWGADCSMVLLDVHADLSDHPSVESAFERLYREDKSSGPILQAVPVELNLFDASGLRRKTFAYAPGHAPRMVEFTAGPCWKFW